MLFTEGCGFLRDMLSWEEGRGGRTEPQEELGQTRPLHPQPGPVGALMLGPYTFTTRRPPHPAKLQEDKPNLQLRITNCQPKRPLKIVASSTSLILLTRPGEFLLIGRRLESQTPLPQGPARRNTPSKAVRNGGDCGKLGRSSPSNGTAAACFLQPRGNESGQRL